MSNNSDNILQTIDATLSDPVFIIDYQGNYIEVIGGEIRSLYSSSDFLIGKNIHDVLPEKLSARFINLFYLLFYLLSYLLSYLLLSLF